MIRKQVLKAVERLFERVDTSYLRPSKADFDDLLPHTLTSTKVAIQHLLHMRERMQESGEKYDFDTPKLNRWLGFMQGVLWMHGTFSINEMGKINGDAMKEFALEEGWLDPNGPFAADVLCDMLNVLVQPKEETADTPPGLTPFVFTLPFDGVKRNDHARSPAEAFEYTLWRLWSLLGQYIRRREPRARRIERLAEELTKALAEAA